MRERAREREHGSSRGRRAWAWALGRALMVAALTLALLAPELAAAAEAEARRDQVYLAELSLVVDGTRRLLTYCDHHATTPELVRFAHPLSERYVEMATRMLPSAKLAVAHPHLLLVVENLERALDAAAASDKGGYQKRMRIAREELSNLEAVLKQLRQRLPEPPR